MKGEKLCPQTRKSSSAFHDPVDSDGTYPVPEDGWEDYECRDRDPNPSPLSCVVTTVRDYGYEFWYSPPFWFHFDPLFPLLNTS